MAGVVQGYILWWYKSIHLVRNGIILKQLFKIMEVKFRLLKIVHSDSMWQNTPSSMIPPKKNPKIFDMLFD